MRVLLFLSVAVCLTYAQSNFFQVTGTRGRQFRRPQQQFSRPPQQNVIRNGGGGGGGGGAVHDTFGGHEYHYSWRTGRTQMSGQQAAGYCRGLGNGWHAVDIESSAEDNFVSRVIQGERLEYIWTGGVLGNGGFRWTSGTGLGYNNWSHTGGARRPQPDQRENGHEPCLAILNNFYGDGVKWHDVACSHRKPTICERG